MNKQIFISLTHTDTDIAQAIKDVLFALFSDHINVSVSTSKEIDSGINLGEDWIAWIAERVKTCDFVLALITPTSIGNAWILWELAAIYGAAAAGLQAERKILPLLYRVHDDDIPSPLRDSRIRYKRGDNRLDTITLFTDIVDSYREDIPPEVYRGAITLLASEKAKSLESVSEESAKSLQQLWNSRAIIGAYFRMVNVALDAAAVPLAKEDWFEGLIQNSSYPIICIASDARTEHPVDLTIHEASASAEIFYGFPPYARALVGKKLSDLFEILQNWMDPNDFRAFVVDQKTMGARFAKGKFSTARVPIVFNDNHPTPALRGKSFLPYTLHVSQGAVGPFMTNLYIDLSALPLQLKKGLPSPARSVPPRKSPDAKSVEPNDYAAKSLAHKQKVDDTKNHPHRKKAPGEVMVFISYRRQDSADITGRIRERLVRRFGKEAVYQDVDSIPLGVDFRKHLQDSVAQCDVFLAVIGKNWLAACNETGGRRLDDPGDHLRIEIEEVLKRDIPVIPLLVQGATLPHEQDLPTSLELLASRNAVPIRPDPDYRHDMDRLISGIQKHLEIKKTR